jgi:peptide/nickel transport system permease protein
VQAVVTIFIVTVLIFFVTQAMPGDVSRVILGTRATPEAVAGLREQLGLDRPLWTQYWSWMGGVLHGDFGRSLASGQEVTTMLGARVRNSLVLALISMIVMIPVSLLMGIMAAQRRQRPTDKAFLGISMVVNATPEFVIGTVLVALLGTTVLHWLPPVSFIPPADSPLQHFSSLVLPALTLIIPGVMYLSRLVRVSFIDAMSSEYIQTARLKGLSTRRILYRHALPNALAPIIPAASLVAAYTVGGVVVVEYLFGYPGIGAALVEAVGNRDLPVIQAVVLIIATSYFLLNLIADSVAPGDGKTR